MSRFERWSRRKLNSETLDAGEDIAVGEEIKERPVEGHDEPAGDSQASDTHALGEDASSADPAPGSLDDSLPDPDSLPPGSDIKAFLEPGVSQGLRRRALRRLFSGENYGIRDGLDDYDDDYREKLKPLASELAQRMRQWTRPVDPLEEEDSSEEALAEDKAPISHEDAVADQQSDNESEEGHKKTYDSTDATSTEVEDPSTPAALDEGRVGARHQFDQD